jgi:hypothetical protein
MREDGMSDLNPAPRLLMGPADQCRSSRAARNDAQLLGQFDPQFREYMKEVSELYRGRLQEARTAGRSSSTAPRARRSKRRSPR